MLIDAMRTMLLLWLGIVLLQPPGVSLAQTLAETEGIFPLVPLPEDIRMDAQDSQFNEETVEVLHSGNGAAFVDNNSHPFWISVVSAKTIEPKSMRKMLTSNRSLDEIRAALGQAESATRFSGAIKLGESIYPLADIKMRQTNENLSTLDANVIEPGVSLQSTGYAPAIMGQLSLNIIGSDRDLSAEGDLSLYRGPQAADYRIFLDLQPH